MSSKPNSEPSKPNSGSSNAKSLISKSNSGTSRSRRRDKSWSPSPAEIPELLASDEDFIVLRRFDYSLTQLLRRYPDGVPDAVAAQALGLSEVDLAAAYEGVVVQLRESMGAA